MCVSIKTAEEPARRGFVYCLFTFCDIFCLLFVEDNVNKKLLHKNNSSLKTSVLAPSLPGTGLATRRGRPVFLWIQKISYTSGGTGKAGLTRLGGVHYGGRLGQKPLLASRSSGE